MNAKCQQCEAHYFKDYCLDKPLLEEKYLWSRAKPVKFHDTLQLFDRFIPPKRYSKNFILKNILAVKDKNTKREVSTEHCQCLFCPGYSNKSRSIYKYWMAFGDSNKYLHVKPKIDTNLRRICCQKVKKIKFCRESLFYFECSLSCLHCFAEFGYDCEKRSNQSIFVVNRNAIEIVAVKSSLSLDAQQTSALFRFSIH